MKRTLRLTAMVLLGGCLFAGALALQQGNQIRLESSDGRYREARVRTGNDVRIVRRLSSTGCVINRNWGFDSNKIWVDNGCRAIFEYGRNARWDDRWDDRYDNRRRDDRWDDRYDDRRGRNDRWDDRWDNNRYGGDWRRLRLESTNGRRVSRSVPNRGVNLLRQLSSTPCRQGRSWGYNSNGIWVDDGCRAEFEVRLR